MRFCLASGPVTAALLLAGCGSSTSASKDNFAKAINTALAKNCITVNPLSEPSMNVKLNGLGYPVSVEKADASHNLGIMGTSQAAADRTNARLFGPFDALVKAGLLSSTTGQVKDPIIGNLVPGKTYSLTDAGQKALRKDSVAFCAGHWKVKEVTNFTAPGKALTGATMSTVEFTYVAEGVPQWATSDVTKAGFPDYDKTITATQRQEGRADLTLMSNGWQANITRMQGQGMY